MLDEFPLGDTFVGMEGGEVMTFGLLVSEVVEREAWDMPGGREGER